LEYSLTFRGRQERWVELHERIFHGCVLFVALETVVAFSTALDVLSSLPKPK
jgi:hypothetical protein